MKHHQLSHTRRSVIKATALGLAGALTSRRVLGANSDIRVADGEKRPGGLRTVNGRILLGAESEVDGSGYFTQLFSLPTGSLLAASWVVREQTVSADGACYSSSLSLPSR